MNERQADVREPMPESKQQAEAAPSASPASPTRERERQSEGGYPTTDGNIDTVDERAAPTTKTEPMARGQAPSADRSQALIQDQRWEYFAGRWEEIQSGFVDDPRRTVEQADRLVAEVIDQLAKIFREERAQLESQWSKSGKVETEDLRIAMQRYRDFFGTLVGR